MRRLTILMLLFTCLALAGLAAFAAAANQSYKTKTTLFEVPNGIGGQLSSSKAACLKGRALKVGYAGIYGPALVRPDSKGRWEWTSYRAPEAGWKAIVGISPKVLSSVPNHKRTCRGGSKEKTF